MTLRAGLAKVDVTVFDEDGHRSLSSLSGFAVQPLQ